MFLKVPRSGVSRAACFLPGSRRRCRRRSEGQGRASSLCEGFIPTPVPCCSSAPGVLLAGLSRRAAGGCSSDCRRCPAPLPARCRRRSVKPWSGESGQHGAFLPRWAALCSICRGLFLMAAQPVVGWGMKNTFQSSFSSRSSRVVVQRQQQ